jgi:energy-coupling factor transport system permease protein
MLRTYSAGFGTVHGLDPRVKVVWMMVMFLLAVTTSKPVLLVVYLGIGIVVAVVSRLDLKGLTTPLRFVAILVVAVALLQAFVQRTGYLVARLGPLEVYSDALVVAASVGLRVATIFTVSLAVVRTVNPGDFGQMLAKLGMNYRYAMLITLALRFFPIMQRELVKIFESQMARGLELEGSLRRLVRLPVVILPFILRSLKRSGELAMAMELKAFGYAKERTWQRELRLSTVDRSALWAMAAFSVLYIVVRVLRPDLF